MKKLALLLLCATCTAQVNGNRPNLDYSYPGDTIGATSGQVTMPDGVQSGELIVVCGATGIPNATPVTYPITDTAGNTYTNLSPVVIPQGTQTNNAEIQISYAIAGSTVSSLTISGLGGTGVNFQAPGMTVGIYKNISSTTDGTASATSSSTSNPSLTANLTTTVNGDLIVGCSAANGTSGLGHTTWTPANTSQYSARDNYAQLQSFQIAGAAGSQSVTHMISYKGGGQPTGLAIVAFKPSGIAVTTTAMPDGGAAVAYSAQLQAVGGAGAYTWSALSGLPAWATLNSSTGVVSGSNPTAGTSTVNFQVTDGTNTTTKSLTITIGNTLNTPVVRSAMSINSTGTGNFNVTANCGDSILVVIHGQDSHGTHGWVNSVNGANNRITDSFNLVPQRIYPVSGSGNAPIVALLMGPIPQSGVDTVFITTNAGGSSLGGTISVIGGVQPRVDDGTFNSTMQQNISGSYTLTGSFTTVVPNELLYEFFADDQDGDITDAVATVGFSAPLSISLFGNQTYDNFALGTAPISSASTTSTTTSVTTTQTFAGSALTHFALRPSVTTSTCGNFVGLGEKIKRWTY